MRLGRKGSTMDIFYLMFVFLVLGIMMLVAVYLKDQVFPQFTAAFGTTSEATNIMNTTENAFNTMDNVFLFVYFMMSFTTIIFAALVRTHPVFFIVNVILMVILFIITPTFSNIMREFWAVTEFAPYAAGGTGSITFPVMTRIFQYLPIVVMGISIILMIASFAKRESVGATY